MGSQLPKGKGMGRIGGKGRIRGKKGHYDSHTNCRGCGSRGGSALGKEYNTEKTSSDSVASYYTDG